MKYRYNNLDIIMKGEPNMALYKNTAQPSPREVCTRRYNTAVNSILLIIILTIVNIALVMAGQDMYFLFSSSIPFYLVAQAAILCGVMPDAFYMEYYKLTPEEIDFYSQSYLYAMIAIAAIFIVFYAVTWFFARKGKVGFLIAALAVFAVDTVSLFVFFGSDLSTGIMDIVIHALVIIEFVLGIASYFKIKKLPPEPVYQPMESPAEQDNGTDNAQ